jgi:hypothetical protein
MEYEESALAVQWELYSVKWSVGYDSFKEWFERMGPPDAAGYRS